MSLSACNTDDYVTRVIFSNERRCYILHILQLLLSVKEAMARARTFVESPPDRSGVRAPARARKSDLETILNIYRNDERTTVLGQLNHPTLEAQPKYTLSLPRPNCVFFTYTVCPSVRPSERIAPGYEFRSRCCSPCACTIYLSIFPITDDW